MYLDVYSPQFEALSLNLMTQWGSQWLHFSWSPVSCICTKTGWKWLPTPKCGASVTQCQEATLEGRWNFTTVTFQSNTCRKCRWCRDLSNFGLSVWLGPRGARWIVALTDFWDGAQGTDSSADRVNWSRINEINDRVSAAPNVPTFYAIGIYELFRSILLSSFLCGFDERMLHHDASILYVSCC